MGSGSKPEACTRQTNKISVNKAEAKEILDDPNAFLKQALFKPNSKGGKTQGFRVTNIRTNSLLKKLGLENGDVLMRINGEMITGPTKLLQVYGSLGGASAISIDVERKGQMLPSSLSLSRNVIRNATYQYRASPRKEKEKGLLKPLHSPKPLPLYRAKGSCPYALSR